VGIRGTRWSSGFSLRKWTWQTEPVLGGMRWAKKPTVPNVNPRRLKPEIQHTATSGKKGIEQQQTETTELPASVSVLSLISCSKLFVLKTGIKIKWQKHRTEKWGQKNTDLAEVV
jgi:hypothetical protein